MSNNLPQSFENGYYFFAGNQEELNSLISDKTIKPVNTIKLPSHLLPSQIEALENYYCLSHVNYYWELPLSFPEHLLKNRNERIKSGTMGY